MSNNLCTCIANNDDSAIDMGPCPIHPVSRPPVPRVAHSLDDLRVGQQVALRTGTTPTWSIHQIANLDGWYGTAPSRIVILSDPPPEPVTVSREAFDRLAEALALAAHSGLPKAGYPLASGLAEAARALVDEVRQAQS